MNTAAWWWAAGASPDNPDGPSPGPGPGPGFEIGQSLRFRGAASLTRTAAGTSSVWTSSYWVKRGAIGGVGGTAEDALFSSNGFN